MINKNDKRIVKTLAAIRSAFIALVQEKEFSEISISELTKRANITRSTFYMYYDSVSAVRDEIENEMLKSLDKFIVGANVKAALKDPYPFLKALSEKIMSYDEMNRYLLSDNSGQLLNKIKSAVVNAFAELVPQERKEERVSARYIATFLAAGILDSYKEWFLHRDGMELEDMCRKFSDIIVDSAKLVCRI